MATGVTGVELKLGFFPLAFLLFLCTPRVEIDGQAPISKYWGTHFFELPPGKHSITVYFQYLFSRCGQNTISVDVPQGAVKHVSYWMPPWVLAKGSMKVS